MDERIAKIVGALEHLLIKHRAVEQELAVTAVEVGNDGVGADRCQAARAEGVQLALTEVQRIACS